MKYEQVRVELPPFISQHKSRLAWGGVSAHVGACVLAYLWRRFPGPEGRCICSCTQAVPVCLWERMRSKCGCAGVSEGRMLHMGKCRGRAVHNPLPRDNEEDPYPYMP